MEIAPNLNVTLTGSIFDELEIHQGSTVKFTSTSVKVSEIDAEQHVTFKFNNNTRVMVRDKVELDHDCNINPDGLKVTFYVGDSTNDPKEFELSGKNSNITANIYIPHGSLSIHGGGNGCSNPTYGTVMTGLFIADKIDNDGKNVNWNTYSCGAARHENTQDTSHAISVVESAEKEVHIYPNPATSVIHIQASSGRVNVSMYTIEGQLVIHKDDAYKIDISGLANGVYILQAYDENNTLLKTSRIVKNSW